MKLLVLGGTKFLGRAAVEAALARGHEVTLFNRGETNPELHPEAEKLRGDREHDLSALAGRTWDAVIDPSGYVPHVVRASAEALADSAGHYLFISSVSVYADFSEPRDEASPLEELAEDKPDDRLARGLLELRRLEGALRARSRGDDPRPLTRSSARGSSSARTTRRDGSPTGPTESPAAARSSFRGRPSKPSSSSTSATWRAG